MFSYNKLQVILTYLMIILVCSCCDNTPVEKSTAVDRIMQSDSLLQYFISTHPAKEVIKFARADVNDSGTEDMVVIYRAGQDKNMMEVVFDVAGKLHCSNEVPAPATNQLIQFKDIDKRPPLEFIVQGMKDAKVGYAIYRLEEGRLVDLFGEGMEDCC